MDSNAIHVVLLVTIMKRVEEKFLVKVSNPTMGMVCLCFGPSAYPCIFDFFAPLSCCCRVPGVLFLAVMNSISPYYSMQ
jgi:hypothetical protein